jgi:hypothetical protein
VKNAEHVNNIRFEIGNGGKVLCSKRRKKFINIEENLSDRAFIFEAGDRHR